MESYWLFLIFLCAMGIESELTKIRKAVELSFNGKKIDSAESLENSENSQTG